MPEADYTAEELQANDLLDQLNAVVDGEDMAIGLVAVLACVRDVAAQADPEIRMHAIRVLQEITCELEAMDATTKH